MTMFSILPRAKYEAKRTLKLSAALDKRFYLCTIDTSLLMDTYKKKPNALQSPEAKTMSLDELICNRKEHEEAEAEGQYK